MKPHHGSPKKLKFLQRKRQRSNEAERSELPTFAHVPWHSELWEIVALATAGANDDNLARRAIAVNHRHSPQALLDWARLVVRLAEAAGETDGALVRICGPAHAAFRDVPLFVLRELLVREDAREKRAVHDTPEAKVKCEQADARFNAAMLSWARGEILAQEGRRDSRSAAVLEGAGWTTTTSWPAT